MLPKGREVALQTAGAAARYRTVGGNGGLLGRVRGTRRFDAAADRVFHDRKQDTVFGQQADDSRSHAYRKRRGSRSFDDPQLDQRAWNAVT